MPVPVILSLGAAMLAGGWGTKQAFEGAADATEAAAKLVLVGGLVVGVAYYIKQKAG